MIRLCVLGNSHLAALKMALDDGLPREGNEITFFGSGREGLAELQLRDGALVPRSDVITRHLSLTSAGHASITIGDFDAFLLHGLSLSLRPLVKAHARDFSFLPEQRTPFVTRSCFVAACARDLLQTLCFRLARDIRSITDRPILVSPQPFASEDVLEKTDRELYRLAPEHREQMRLAYVDCVEHAATLAGVRALHQPLETVAHGLFTRAHFAKNARYLNDRPRPETELVHMNGEYGKLVWESLFDALRTGGR